MAKAGLGASFAPAYVLAKLPPLYATEAVPVEDKPLLAKWFSPYTGWRWYAAEYDPETRTCFGWVEGHEREWGYFSLAELEAARGMGGRLPLVERDHYHDSITLRELQAAA